MVMEVNCPYSPFSIRKVRKQGSACWLTHCKAFGSASGEAKERGIIKRSMKE